MMYITYISIAISIL